MIIKLALKLDESKKQEFKVTASIISYSSPEHIFKDENGVLSPVINKDTMYEIAKKIVDVNS